MPNRPHATISVLRETAFVLLCLMVALLCSGVAHGSELRPTITSFFATAYSNDATYIDNEEAPNARARISMQSPITQGYIVTGPVLWRPALSFVWEAHRWPIGADSSPIGENNQYQPEAYIEIAPGTDLSLFGIQLVSGRLGWLHVSNGQAADAASASLDRAEAEANLLWRGWLVSFQGWYVIAAGSETADIRNYINFAEWENIGGEFTVQREFEGIASIKFIAGLTSQDVEVRVPFASFWRASLFGWAHRGEADGIVDYANDHFAGGFGLSVDPAFE